MHFLEQILLNCLPEFTSLSFKLLKFSLINRLFNSPEYQKQLFFKQNPVVYEQTIVNISLRITDNALYFKLLT